MKKYRVLVTVTLTSEITVEGPDDIKAIAKVVKNDISLNFDDWIWDRKTKIEPQEEEAIETPQFMLDNGMLIDYDTPRDEDIENDT